jgi:hypothetical protein
MSQWFSVSVPGRTNLLCAMCGNDVDLRSPSVDHDPSICPACKRDCVFFSWKSQMVQLVPEVAPPAMAALIRWAQRELQTFEFVELLVSLDALSKKLHDWLPRPG